MNRPSRIVSRRPFRVIGIFRRCAENVPVVVTENDRTYTLDNGIVKAIVAKSSGDLVSLKYKDLEMLATFIMRWPSDLDRDPTGENHAGLNRGMTDHQYGFWSHDAMGAAGRRRKIPRSKEYRSIRKPTAARGEVSIKGVSIGWALGTGPGSNGGQLHLRHRNSLHDGPRRVGGLHVLHVRAPAPTPPQPLPRPVSAASSPTCLTG